MELFFHINQKYKHIIENKLIQELNKIDIEKYYNQGILIEKYIDEIRYIKHFTNKDKYFSKVLSLTILLTMDCNFRCVYCFEGKKTEKKEYISHEKKEAIKKMVNIFLEQDNNIEVIGVTLFGGEPLLDFSRNIQWLNEFREECEKKGKKFIVNVVTNGALITDEILDGLKKCNCNDIQITLDGVEEVHNKRRVYVNGEGTFNDVLNGIKTIYKREDFNFPTIRINIDKENIDNVDVLLEILAKEGLTGSFIDFGIVRGENEEIKDYENKCFKDRSVFEAKVRYYYTQKCIVE